MHHSRAPARHHRHRMVLARVRLEAHAIQAQVPGRRDSPHARAPRRARRAPAADWARRLGGRLRLARRALIADAPDRSPKEGCETPGVAAHRPRRDLPCHRLKRTRPISIRSTLSVQVDRLRAPDARARARPSSMIASFVSASSASAQRRVEAEWRHRDCHACTGLADRRHRGREVERERCAPKVELAAAADDRESISARRGRSRRTRLKRPRRSRPSDLRAAKWCASAEERSPRARAAARPSDEFRRLRSRPHRRQQLRRPARGGRRR